MFKKPISTKEGGVLASLFRKIVIENNLINSLDYLIDRYVTETGSKSKNIKRKNRSSLIKYISANDMTWKTFLTLVFDFLGAIKLEFTIKVTFPNKHESVHKVTLTKNIIEKKESKDESN